MPFALRRFSEFCRCHARCFSAHSWQRVCPCIAGWPQWHRPCSLRACRFPAALPLRVDGCGFVLGCVGFGARAEFCWPVRVDFRRRVDFVRLIPRFRSGRWKCASKICLLGRFIPTCSLQKAGRRVGRRWPAAPLVSDSSIVPARDASAPRPGIIIWRLYESCVVTRGRLPRRAVRHSSQAKCCNWAGAAECRELPQGTARGRVFEPPALFPLQGVPGPVTSNSAVHAVSMLCRRSVYRLRYRGSGSVYFGSWNLQCSSFSSASSGHCPPSAFR